MTTGLKLEVGKTYVTRNGHAHIIILFKDGDVFVGRPVSLSGNYRRYCLDGQMRGHSPDALCNLVKEYREPLVIQRDSVLIREKIDKRYSVSTVNVGQPYINPLWDEISRQTVTFTVED